MLFSSEPRTAYQNNQLAEVICQLRFPTILAIGAQEPVAFQDAVRHDFPRYAARREQPAPKVVSSGKTASLEQQAPVINYNFISADGTRKLNLTSSFISMSCLRYETWEQFAKEFDRPLAAFIKHYDVSLFDRMGLRYVNTFSRQQLGLVGTPWRELITPSLLGPLADADVREEDVGRASTEMDLRLPDDCKLHLRAGPGLVSKNGQTDPELRFIADIDVSMTGNLTGDRIPACLDTLHQHAASLFRGAITDTLHKAMRPL